MLGGLHQISFYRKGKAYPKKLAQDEANIELVENLLFLFKTSIGKTQGDLEEELKSLPNQGQAPKVTQGLAKILMGQCTFEKQSDQDLGDLREEVFDLAAQAWKAGVTAQNPEEVSAEINKNLNNLTQQEVQAHLFGDLASHLQLRESPPFTAASLV